MLSRQKKKERKNRNAMEKKNNKEDEELTYRAKWKSTEVEPDVAPTEFFEESSKMKSEEVK